MSDRDELADLIDPHYDISYDDNTGKVHCMEGDWAGYERHSEHVADLVFAAGFRKVAALDALLVELDARPTITTTYGNAAHLIRQALEADKDQP